MLCDTSDKRSKVVTSKKCFEPLVRAKKRCKMKHGLQTMVLLFGLVESDEEKLAFQRKVRQWGRKVARLREDPEKDKKVVLGPHQCRNQI